MNTSPEWTPEAIRSLGPTTSLRTLGAIVGVSEKTAYAMRRDGTWEQIGIRIIPAGTHYRVIVASILTVLGYSTPDDSTTHGPPATSPGAPQPAILRAAPAEGKRGHYRVLASAPGRARSPGPGRYAGPGAPA